MRVVFVLTMTSGNWSSIYKEMAGNILSEVNGTSEVYAATANELNATSTRYEDRRVFDVKLYNYSQGTPVQSEVLTV